jgi:hypothetical protein
MHKGEGTLITVDAGGISQPTLIVVEVHLADILAGSSTRLHLGRNAPSLGRDGLEV